METEIKLGFSSEEDMDRLWKDPLFSSLYIPGSEREVELETIYFDTADHELRKMRASLRVRKNGEDGYIHTLKQKVEAKDGLHQRYEWNMESDSDSFSADFFGDHAVSNGDPDEILDSLLDAIRGRDLRELFSTRYKRKTFMAGFDDSLLEVALDTGTLLSGGMEEFFCEMEIELKEGDVRDIISLGEEIMANSSAFPDSRSKYSRCFSLLERRAQQG